jgi:hypothetical protein
MDSTDYVNANIGTDPLCGIDICVGTDATSRFDTGVGTDDIMCIDTCVGTDSASSVDICVGTDPPNVVDVSVSAQFCVEKSAGNVEVRQRKKRSRTPLLDSDPEFDGQEPAWISAVYDPYADFVPVKPDHKIRVMCNQIIPKANVRQPILRSLAPEDKELAEVMIDCVNRIFNVSSKHDIEIGLKVASSVVSTFKDLAEGCRRQYYVDLDVVEAFHSLLYNFKDKFMGIT